jgi:formamidopyrimidine-DNA glycosylase
MPELPEVEVVRRGIDTWVSGRTIETTQVLHSRAVRNHIGGSKDFARRLKGRTITSVNRRGKFMWLSLDDDHALVTHLGMSGQVLVQPLDAQPEKHMRVRCTFTDGGRAMHFVDQRTFGGMAIHELVEVDHGQWVPEPVVHIARDPLDPFFDPDSFITGIRKKNTQVKPEALVLDIPHIKTELLLPGEGIAAIDLSPTTEARLDIMATGLLSGIKR